MNEAEKQSQAEVKKKLQASCPHPSFSQERMGYGQGTGDYYCDKCGIDRDLVIPRS